MRPEPERRDTREPRAGRVEPSRGRCLDGSRSYDCEMCNLACGSLARFRVRTYSGPFGARERRSRPGTDITITSVTQPRAAAGPSPAAHARARRAHQAFTRPGRESQSRPGRWPADRGRHRRTASARRGQESRALQPQWLLEGGPGPSRERSPLVRSACRDSLRRCRGPPLLLVRQDESIVECSDAPGLTCAIGTRLGEATQ